MLWGITIRFQKLSLSQRQVAHVLLTRPPLRILIKNQNSPFDLHVLSVPPAFVLSQDQTLYDSCISIIPFRMTWNQSCSITLALLLSCFLVLSWLSFSFLQRNFKGRYFFLALFGFQDAVSVSLSSEAALLLYHSFFNLSSTFFKFFQIIFFSCSLPLFWAATFILYHTVLTLSSTFFKNFFQKLFSKVLSIPLKSPGSVKRLSLRSDLPRSLSLSLTSPSPTAFLLYHDF